MIGTYDFERDKDNRELIRSFSAAFPCSCKYTDLGHSSVPWHWHPAVEIDYIVDGTVDFTAENQTFRAEKGDVIFENINVVHCVRPVFPSETSRNYTLFFDLSFLGGTGGSVIETKYLYPIVRSQALRSYRIRPDGRRHLRMIGQIMDAIDLYEKEPFGYEFQVRSLLSEFWCLLLEDTEELRRSDGALAAQSKTLSDRMRPMLDFIAEHYGEDIRLRDIARAGAVSERECSRIFAKAIGTSAMSHLSSYRIETAARELVMRSDSIGDIAGRCGFSSESHFAQVFRASFGCTPREYRKIHAGDAS